MSDLITIIVPIYKVEKYLERCIDSILNQTYKNIEIILVDDGSPDKCGEICDYYQQYDERIKVIHKMNGGLSESRNEGIKIANGKYLSFLDSDDWVSEKYIEKLYQLLKEYNADISVVNYIKKINEKIKKDNSKEEINEYSNIQAISKMYDKNTNIQMIVSWGKLYKKRLFKNIKFPSGKIHEDEFTTYKLLYYSNKVVMSSAKLLYYWQREDSIVGSKFNINHRDDAYEAFEERLKFFNHNSLNELYSRTCKEMLFHLIETMKKVKKEKLIVNLEKISSKSKELRINLRKSKQKLFFKIYYELYFKLLGETKVISR